MSDYRIEAATKEEWAARALAAEAKLAEAVATLRRIMATSQVMSADYIEGGGESGHERTARIAFDCLSSIQPKDATE